MGQKERNEEAKRRTGVSLLLQLPGYMGTENSKVMSYAAVSCTFLQYIVLCVTFKALYARPELLHNQNRRVKSPLTGRLRVSRPYS